MTDWNKVNYLRQGDSQNYDFELILPEPLASWDVYDYWEKVRTESMRDRLKKGDTLFDIGAEHGWLSVVYAHFVGASNMVLIEPTKEFWPNIRQTWERNLNDPPKACYAGLFSDKTTAKYITRDWPPDSDGELIDKNKYEYIHSNSGIPEVKLDEYVAATGIKPNALTIDTEGSELLILKGARTIIEACKPIVWVSEHPDLAFKDYGVKENEVADFMKSLGYKRTVLGIDHEVHVLYDSL